MWSTLINPLFLYIRVNLINYIFLTVSIEFVGGFSKIRYPLFIFKIYKRYLRLCGCGSCIGGRGWKTVLSRWRKMANQFHLERSYLLYGHGCGCITNTKAKALSFQARLLFHLQMPPCRYSSSCISLPLCLFSCINFVKISPLMTSWVVFVTGIREQFWRLQEVGDDIEWVWSIHSGCQRVTIGLVQKCSRFGWPQLLARHSSSSPGSWLVR